jgi:hypothetical protein
MGQVLVGDFARGECSRLFRRNSEPSVSGRGEPGLGEENVSAVIKHIESLSK